jgi:flagellar hook assembly protein FlgD
VSSPTAFPRDVWVHLAATYDGTTLKLYENGSLTQSMQYATSQGIGNPASIHIGEFCASYYYGFIDDLAVYNRALSAGEIDVPPLVKLLLPASGLTRNNTPLLNYTVSSGTVTVKVDGNVVSKVSGNSLDALPDGDHTVRVEAVSGFGKMGFAEVTFTVDTIATVSIDPVTTPTHLTSQTITGTREANSTVTVAVNTSAVAGLVTYPTPTTWSSTITQLAAGGNALTVTARDAVENTATATTSIALYNAPLSSVGISRNAINAALSETATISFTVDSPASVTLKIISLNGASIYQASQTCATAGAYGFIWDGRNSAGAVVPDDAYLYTLEATDGTNLGIYSPSAPTGTGSVSCSQSADYDPFKNEPLTVSYSVAQPARVNISISWFGQSFKIMDAVPHVSGNYTFDWDGRNPQGYALSAGATSSCAAASLLSENLITTSGDAPKITLLKTDPYQVHFSYGQFTRVSYALSRTANVTMKLFSPSGAPVTLFNDVPQAVGPHVCQWDGISVSCDGAAIDVGATGNILVSGEGDYIVWIQAVNPSPPGSSSITRGSLNIGF